MVSITAASNKTYKFIKSLSMKKARCEYGCFIVEGIKSVYEALLSDVIVDMLLISEGALSKCSHIIKLSEQKNIQVYSISDSLFSSACDTKTPEGVLCVARMYKSDKIDYKNGLYLYCDNLSDPGNAGTLIRCADAVGASGVFFSKGSVDIYNPKTVRATMGSLFHLPVYDGVDENILLDMKNQKFSVYAGALTDSALDYKEVAYPENTVIIVGNEANGVSDSVMNMIDRAVIIPILGRAESLNASVAGSILMYEWRRNN
ncbi:MAG: RNA methyltransferase [Ruminococcaceae bacterium]|nr:RNA methyltransferase [Oscillospiraceae bacterium]